MQIPSMPFTIVALAPFTSDDGTAWKDGLFDIDADTFDDVLATLNPIFAVPVPREVCPAGCLDITCSKMKDFHPDGLAKSNTFLKHLFAAKGFIEDCRRKGMDEREIVQGMKRWPDLPALAFPDKPGPSQSPSSSALDNILKMVSLPQESASSAVKAAPLTEQIDSIVQQNLHHIFMHEQFRCCEAAWRGLQFLVKQVRSEAPVRLQIAPVTNDTLEDALEAMLPALVRDLPSLIVVDLGFDISARSLALLEKIASLAETLLVPCLAWITPKFFHLDTWDELGRLPYLPSYMDEMSFAKWRRLRGLDSSRWLSLCCNRFLTRYPYGSDNPARMIRFQEEGPLWISPVWAAGALMTQSLARYGWPTRFSADNKVRLEDLAMQADATGKSLAAEILITEERIDQLIRCGIMPLMGSYNTDTACMPRETTAGSITLSHQLFVSTISRFILWCRDHFSDDLSAPELEEALKEAFSLFWHQSSREDPEELIITATKTGPDDRIMVGISIKPSRRVLPSAGRMDMEFYW